MVRFLPCNVASVRYIAHELDSRGIRVNAISASVVATRATSGSEHFEEYVNDTVCKARMTESREADRASLLLASDFHIEDMMFH